MVLELHELDTNVLHQLWVHLAQVFIDHVVQLSCHLHTGRAAAHNDKCQPLLDLLDQAMSLSWWL